MDILGVLTAELGVKMSQVEAAVKLIDEGNTIPFIARYRKEVTGSLNDEVLRNLDERLKYLRGLEDRKTQILASIEDQGKLTADLKRKIEEAETMVAVEDLYLPFRPKRKTRASMAKERGLEPLADTIMLQVTKEPIETLAAQYVSEEKGVADAKAAIDGAKDILAERISEVAKYRAYIRNVTKEEGSIVSAAKDEKTESVYEMYYHHEELVRKCAGHRILALNRGEKEKILTVKIAAPEEKILRYLNKMVITRENPVTTPVLQEVIADSYNRLIAPAIEREVRNLMTEKAEDGAIMYRSAQYAAKYGTVNKKKTEDGTEEEAKEEAFACAYVLNGRKLDYPIFFDTEASGASNGSGRADGLGMEDRTKCAIAFCEEVKAQGYKPGVYASTLWYRKRVNLNSLKKYTIWNAHYGVASSPIDCALWQGTCTARLPGYKGDMDVNISYIG